MSEDDKPIFPRPNDKSDEEKQKLYQETKQKLENVEGGQKINCIYCQTENSFSAKFCRVCGKELILSKAPPSPIEFDEPSSSIMYGPPPTEFDENTTKTEEFPNLKTVQELSPDDIHTTMYGPAPLELEERIDPPPSIMYGPPVLEITRELPKTLPEINLEEAGITKVDKGNSLPLGLNYEEWKDRIPWLIIGGIIGFLIASVIILTLVLLVVAIR
ncbi:MAG TPA: zinc ribbon domain-containing protein [Pyrinomonadaceae bacterium]|nr:zinc ribbon domain-containing protein [Pyrinomonadaceae bacterium]